MKKEISIRQFIRAIRRLPSDQPRHYPGKWYTTQKQHWLGWLSEYLGPGAYGRKERRDDAGFVYNHIVNHDMLLWLIAAAGINRELVAAARRAAASATTMTAKSAAIRRHVPWPEFVHTIWGH